MVTKEEKQMLRDLREAGVEPAETSMTKISAQTARKAITKTALKNPLVTPDKSKSLVTPDKSKRVAKAWTPKKPTTKDFSQGMNSTQKLLGDMFGGNRMMTGGDFKRPHLQGLLRKGGGILKNGDRGQTGRMFGIR